MASTCSSTATNASAGAVPADRAAGPAAPRCPRSPTGPCSPIGPAGPRGPGGPASLRAFFLVTMLVPQSSSPTSSSGYTCDPRCPLPSLVSHEASREPVRNCSACSGSPRQQRDSPTFSRTHSSTRGTGIEAAGTARRASVSSAPVRANPQTNSGPSRVAVRTANRDAADEAIVQDLDGCSG